ncbi:hypothetical protein HNR42_000793 [Deinobacterium chartae]|uniref:BON domain-containing protein n=1 Tax=Deinobacterium chartae TaxID=521158 RepID=A0A841HYT3_9DEIO|nr:BON domain-containing protein [Deinobacterium chartae]MBB6097379.1 hypothetical protein [Deinobacterium chartae]
MADRYRDDRYREGRYRDDARPEQDRDMYRSRGGGSMDYDRRDMRSAESSGMYDYDVDRRRIPGDRGQGEFGEYGNWGYGDDRNNAGGGANERYRPGERYGAQDRSGDDRRMPGGADGRRGFGYSENPGMEGSDHDYGGRYMTSGYGYGGPFSPSYAPGRGRGVQESAQGSEGGMRAGSSRGYGGGMRQQMDVQRSGPHYGRGPKNYRRSDERIRDEINDELTDHGDIDATNIEVSVQDGEVTLSGTVPDRMQKRMAEDLAETIRGVKDVHNRLRVERPGMQGQEQTAGDLPQSTNAEQGNQNTQQGEQQANRPSRA